MSDTEARAGFERDLQDAEQMIRDAHTAEDLALAFQRHAEAIRNMMQAEMVPAFVNATGSMFSRQFDEILTQRLTILAKSFTDELERQGTIRRAQFDENRTYADARHDATIAEIQQLHTDLTESKRDRAELRQTQEQHTAQLAAHNREIARIKAHLGLNGDGAER